MTPGAGTAQSVSRVGCRHMWRVAAGSRHCGGHPGVTSGARAFGGGRMLFCGGWFAALRWSSGRHKWRPHVWGRLTVVWRRLVRGIAVVIRASQVAPLRLGVVECCFAVVIRASQVAPLRLRRLTVVLRWLVRGVARRGAIYDARCRNGTIRRPCGFFEPSGKGGLHSGGCPKILCFQIVVPHVCITFAA